MKDIDLVAAPITTLLELARGHRVNVYLTNGVVPRAIIRPVRDPALAPLVTALTNRREEVSQYLVSVRPPMTPTPDAEMRFRRDVLHEPDDDALLPPLTMGELRALVARMVYEAMEAERATEEWERQIAGRDDATPPSRAGRAVRV